MLKSLHLTMFFMTILLAAICVFMGVPATPAHAASGASVSPQAVYPLEARPYGRTWGEWTAAWWQWGLSMPVTSHPLFDTADCSAGQSGPVWFLGGAFTGMPTTRTCTVPAGTALLCALVNSECSSVEPPPFYGADEAEMRACARGWMDLAFGPFAVVDGVVIDAMQYRVESPLFTFWAPDNNMFGIPGPVTGMSVSDGYWILLTPLSVGQHTLHFGGSFPGFPIDVTYELTVRGGRGRNAVESVTGTWGTVKQLYR